MSLRGFTRRSSKSTCNAMLFYMYLHVNYILTRHSEGRGYKNSFVYIQRLCDTFIRTCSAEIENSSRALFYSRNHGNIFNFNFQPYLDFIEVKKKSE